jgi:hypothetical protein
VFAARSFVSAAGRPTVIADRDVQYGGDGTAFLHVLDITIVPIIRFYHSALYQILLHLTR